MIEQRHPVDLIATDGSIVAGEFVVRDEASGDPNQVELILVLPSRQVTVVALDCFEALIAIRLELEPEGLKLLCWGASLQVYPSEMSRQMGTGDTAYRLTLGRFARTDDQINIFASGPGLIAATVVEQEDFTRAWFDSLAALE